MFFCMSKQCQVLCRLNRSAFGMISKKKKKKKHFTVQYIYIISNTLLFPEPKQNILCFILLCFICIHALYCLSVLKMQRKVPDQRSRLQDYCTSTVFMQVLLLKGYGFDPNTFSRISFQKKVSSEHGVNVQYT